MTKAVEERKGKAVLSQDDGRGTLRTNDRS